MLRLTSHRGLVRNTLNLQWCRLYSLKRPEGDYENEIFSILENDFKPSALAVQDISGGCGSMFAISIESEKFRGLTPVKQQQLVYKALVNEVPKWHGLQLKAKPPPKE